MYMCQLVVLGVLLVPVSGCICVQSGGAYGVSKEDREEAVEEAIQENRDEGSSEEFPWI